MINKHARDWSQEILLQRTHLGPRRNLGLFRVRMKRMESANLGAHSFRIQTPKNAVCLAGESVLGSDSLCARLVKLMTSSNSMSLSSINMGK